MLRRVHADGFLEPVARGEHHEGEIRADDADILVQAGSARTGCRQFSGSILRRCRMSFVGELWRFLRARKKFWLLPIILINLVLGGILILAQGSAVAPFIYTLF